MRREIVWSLRRMAGALLIGGVLATLTTGCASRREPSGDPFAPTAAQARDLIESAVPASTVDRDGWTTDLDAAFTVLALTPTRENVCAVVAVIAQESSFRVDPVVPGLAKIAWHEIDVRAARAGIPPVVVHGVLKLASSSGRSFGDRIDSARTEKDLSDIYEDFIATVPLGHTLFANDDPIRTRGPMQVHVVFASAFAKTHPYPYPIKRSVADELFTRRGGVYFGVAHLLDYSADYDGYRYRFADFNAGQYASRNAAFQRAVTFASGVNLTADGTLLAPASDRGSGATESALRTLENRLGMSEREIHEALELGKKKEFEQSRLYSSVFKLAESAYGRNLPRAVIPQIELHGPKISHRLTTEWYANRVEQRYERCLNGMQRPASEHHHPTSATTAP